MKKTMCITYIVDGKLYVNVTNRCSNRCDFCIRNNADGAYGSDSLWLEREPTVEEISASILAHTPFDFPELVFCGYGEPSYRLYDIKEVVRRVREVHPGIRVRINTNGHSDLIFKKNTAPDYEGTFDVVSISLNTPTAEKYDEICHSKFGLSAHPSLIKFAENVKNYVQNVQFSLVKESLSPEEIEQCVEISERTGVYLRIRDYIPPES